MSEQTNETSKKCSKIFEKIEKSCYVQAEKEGTVEPLVPWTVVGRPVDGRRRCACRQRRRKKNHLIEAAPFGRLDQM